MSVGRGVGNRLGLFVIGACAGLLVVAGVAHAAALPEVSGGAYRFAVVIDEDPKSLAAAKSFVRELRTTPPFDRLGRQLGITIIKSTQAEMGCAHTSKESPRIVTCNSGKLLTMGAAARAQRTMGITGSGDGGSGGGVPVISADFPNAPRALIHEFMHSLGFLDEYRYSASEASVYCNEHVRSLNVVAFRPRKDPFASDDEAKQLHSGDYPWSFSVKPATLITTSRKLGTSPGVYPPETIALYSAPVCEESKIPTWKPYFLSTIMGTLDSPVPALYARLITQALSSELGHLLWLTPLPVEPGSVVDVDVMVSLKRRVDGSVIPLEPGAGEAVPAR